MSTYDKALAAKEKFKEQHWKTAPDKYNIIAIGAEMFFDVITSDTVTAEGETEIIEIEQGEENYFIKVYLFDILDKVALALPESIDDIEIEYIPVIADI